VSTLLSLILSMEIDLLSLCHFESSAIPASTCEIGL
jgi:hypothetical protein